MYPPVATLYGVTVASTRIIDQINGQPLLDQGASPLLVDLIDGWLHEDRGVDKLHTRWSGARRPTNALGERMLIVDLLLGYLDR